MFYPNEVFRGGGADTNPLHAVISRCAVQHISEYRLLRPLDLSEEDVYVCEALYNAQQKSMSKIATLPGPGLPEGLPARETIASAVDLVKTVPSPFAGKTTAASEVRT